MAQDGGTSLYAGSVPRAVPRWSPAWAVALQMNLLTSVRYAQTP